MKFKHYVIYDKKAKGYIIGETYDLICREVKLEDIERTNKLERAVKFDKKKHAKNYLEWLEIDGEIRKMVMETKCELV